MDLAKLSKTQLQAYCESDARINLYEGAVRSGKSLIALIRFIEELRTGPQGEYLIAGRSEVTIIRNILDPLNDLVGDIIRYNRGQSFFKLFGKKVYCVGANDERAELKIRGATLAGALVDEVTTIPESFFKMLLSRLSVPKSKLLGTTNPDSPFHWLKVDYIDRKEELNLKVFSFRIEDNPGLDPEYVQDLKKEYTGVWYQRFIEGLWVQAEGMVYACFDRDQHIKKEAPSFAEYFIAGVDVGTTNPTAVVVLGYNSKVRPHIWVEKEYYFDSKKAGYQKTDSELVQDIMRHFDGYPIKMWYVDPAALSFQLEMRRNRLPVAPADNSVLDGIRFTASLFSQGDLVILNRCQNLINEIYGYVWDAKSYSDGKERPIKQADHCCDALRYVCMTHYGQRKDLIEKTQAERFAESERRKWNQNPMNYPGYAPGDYGYQSIPMRK